MKKQSETTTFPLRARDKKFLGARIWPGTDREFVRWKDCPECGGRGWFVDDPFKFCNKKYNHCRSCADAADKAIQISMEEGE